MSSTARLIRSAIAVLAIAQISLVAAHSAPAIAELTGLSGDSHEVAAAAEGADEVPPASTTESTTEGESPPTVEAVIDGTLGSNGWYVTDVEVTWTVDDPETPVSSTEGCETLTVTEDTSGITGSCKAVSEGGSRTTTVTIARDATAPADVTVAAVPAASESGWHNQPFTATWTGTDGTSGIDECTTTDYSGPETTTGELSGTCSDAAGNTSSPVAYTFKYDATAPGAGAVPSRQPDHNGWYNHPLEVAWTSDDADATCTEPTPYSGPDTNNTTLEGSCTDPAGNTSTASYSLSYDATAPRIDLRSPSRATYVLRQPVDADYSCDDAMAGVGSCTGTVDDGSAIDTATVGAKTFSVNATDQAGNEASTEHEYAVQYAAAGTSCGGVVGHTILTPIASDGSSVFQQGSTVPAKFRVCDWFGTPVTTAGVVEKFREVGDGAAEVDRAVPSTSSHQSYRAGDSRWIFNISTKAMSAAAHRFTIWLNDGTTIDFGFALREGGSGGSSASSSSGASGSGGKGSGKKS